MDQDDRLDKKLIPTAQMNNLPAQDYDPRFVGPYVPRPQDKVTVGKTASMRNDWYDTVDRYLVTQNPQSEETKRLIPALRKERRVTSPRPQDVDKNILKTDDLEQVFPLDLPHQLVARTAAATQQPLDGTAIDVRDSYIRHMNQQKNWSTIEKQITEPGGQKLDSTITPANAELHENYAGYGHTGLGSMSGRLTPDRRTAEEKTRPVNLWNTALEKDGKPLFEGLRSGAFIDTARDPGEKQANADAKGKAVLEAALIEQLKKMSDKDRAQYLGGGQTFNGTMVSIDLLSGSGGDKGLAGEHHDTLHRLSGRQQNYDVTWDGQQHQIPARWNILDFMAGVNGMNTALGGKVPTTSRNASGQADQNDDSWTGLRQQALSHMTALGGNQDPEMQAKLAKIQALTGQLDQTDMGRSGDYQMPAMLANLAYQLGDSVHFNCKSGKDRTGIMDAETKFMARQLDKNPNVVPDVANPKARNREQNYEHEQMLWESGSLDVLAQNVGGQCLKTADLKGMPSSSDKQLMNNLGGKDKLNELAGLKRYADIDTIATFEQKIGPVPMPVPMFPWTKKGFQSDAEEYVGNLPPVPRAKPLPPIPQRAQQNLQPQPQPQPQQNIVQPLLPPQLPQPDIDPQAPLERTRPKGVPEGAFKLF